MKKRIYLILIVSGFLIPLFLFAQSFETDLYFGLRNNADVSRLQQFLTLQGFYSGPITGNFLTLTREAVKKFQMAKKLNRLSDILVQKREA